MDRYSRSVALLKVGLPLTALAILSTLFLVSRDAEMEAVIPFAQREMEDRLRGQQITAPHFAGTTKDGHEISISAEKMLSDAAGSETSGISATIRLADGGMLSFTAQSGLIHPVENTASFKNDVRFETSEGIKVGTDDLMVSLDGLRGYSTTPISAQSPFGRFSAGKFDFFTESKSDTVQIRFTDGVKLIYDPSKQEPRQ